MLKDKLYRFMRGRYGKDRLGQFLLVIAMTCIALEIFLRSRVIYVVEMTSIFICIFRMFSRNIQARYNENQKFLEYELKIRQIFKYHIYRCPACGQKIRIPRGKGKISIHCRKCGNDFIRYS